jgi:hypothetical protein
MEEGKGEYVRFHARTCAWSDRPAVRSNTFTRPFATTTMVHLS